MDFNKKLKQRFWIAVSYTALGLILVAADAVKHFDNYFFCAFGVALLAMGILRLIRYRKITQDDKTIRKQELTETDERIRMISAWAKSWVFSLSVMSAGILVIVLNLMGRHEEALPFAWFVCSMVVLYWICFTIIRKKY